MSIPMHEYDSTLDAALHYASLGWKLFPVYGASNPDLAKHPVLKEVPHWHQDSTDDKQQLVAWFTGTNYGIGLDCGKSGVFVLDGDRLEAVPQDLNLEAAWSMRGNPERQSWIFKQPETTSIGCALGDWPAGEVKGDGGYVILPPSFHPVGGNYVWVKRSGSMEVSESVLSMLTVKPQQKSEKIYFATTGTPCRIMQKILDNHLANIKEAGLTGNGRQPAMVAAAYAVAGCGSEGHKGASEALKAIREGYYQAVGLDRSMGVLRAEWARAISDLGSKFTDIKPNVCGGSECGLLEDVEDDHYFERQVQHKLETYKIHEEARKRFQLESLKEWRPVAATTIQELKEISEEEDRIQDLMNVDGVVLLIAQRKTGKTTLISNLVRALADEQPLFNLYETRYKKGNIGLFDLEMTPALLGKWLNRLQIKNADRIKIYPARGNVSHTFSNLVAEPDAFSAWLRSEDLQTIIIDPIAPLLSALGLDENNNSDIRRLFTLIRETATQAGVGEVVLSHHAGWGSSTRARGASAFEDMVDVIWRLESNNGERFFSTLGRLGNIPSTEIQLDPATGLLSLGLSDYTF